jgi:hypothetical protein
MRATSRTTPDEAEPDLRSEWGAILLAFAGLLFSAMTILALAYLLMRSG